MSETQTENDSEKLRAFEKKMHDEGAAAFADGPSPWETWDDESDLLKNNRVWEGSSRRIYPNMNAQPSLGDRVLSGLAMLSLATMVVGIAGVYFSDPQPQQFAATGIQPLPVEHTPSATDSIAAGLTELPAPAAGTRPPAEVAPVTDRLIVAPPAPVHRPAPITVAAAPAATTDTAHPVASTEIDTATTAPQHSAANDTDSRPAPSTADMDIKPAGASVAVSTPPTAAPDSTTSTPALTPAATDIANAATSAAEDTAAVNQTLVATPATGPDPVAALADQPALPTTVAGTAPATDTAPAVTIEPEAVAHAAAAESLAQETAAVLAPATAPQPGPAASPATTAAVVPETAAGPETATHAAAEPLAPETVADTTPAATPQTGTAASPAATATVMPETGTAVADTVAGLEALPATTAGPIDTAAEAAADNSAAATLPAPDTVVAIAEQGSTTAATTPAEAAEQAAPAVKSGDWVVNLASYTRKSTASRMLTRFRDKDVDAELVTVMINDKPMHRVRVSGFASSRAAKASIGPLEQQLGLEGVWISRK